MITKLQEKIVIEIANGFDSRWDSICVNIEIDDIDDEVVQSEMSFVFYDGIKEEFDLENEVYDLFEELRNQMYHSSSDGKLWTICDLRISENGEYKFLFSYDAPPRLSSLK